MATLTRSLTPIVAEALFVTSATLVAVIVTESVLAGAKNVAVVAAWLLKVPADAVHVTPAPPMSFVTLAVKTWDCVTVRPPRTGVSVTLMFVVGVGVGAGAPPPPQPETNRRVKKRVKTRTKTDRGTRFARI